MIKLYAFVYSVIFLPFLVCGCFAFGIEPTLTFVASMRLLGWLLTFSAATFVVMLIGGIYVVMM